ncbi:MAG TPA: hypothetical protein VK607_22045 [Kofleriaceae bacterium]|nr:hypothetical protein [Kofleriaceae bacterium]
MRQDTKNQKLLKLNKETVKKLDQSGLGKVIGGGKSPEGPRPQKIGA